MLQKLVLLSLAAIAIARPDGAPICDVDTFDTSNHGGATSDLKYDIAVTPEGNKATIAINDQFVGLLLYVSDASGKHVGSLKSSTGDFKNSPDCGGQSTITHSSSGSKSGKFEWTGTESGPLTVNAIVMKDQKVWNIFKVPLQIGSAPPTETPTVSKEPEVPTVNNGPNQTQEQEPSIMPQASIVPHAPAPVQPSAYSESSPQKKPYHKKKNPKKNNPKKNNPKKNNPKKNNPKKNNPKHSRYSGKHTSSGSRKPCYKPTRVKKTSEYAK